jgi:hypothetical protein
MNLNTTPSTQPYYSGGLSNLRHPSIIEDKKIEKIIQHNEKEEILKILYDELKIEKKIMLEVGEEIDLQKKSNEKIENEVTELNNVLSEKFSLIFKLEMKLDKLKIKRKNKEAREVEGVGNGRSKTYEVKKAQVNLTNMDDRVLKSKTGIQGKNEKNIQGELNDKRI